mmetsp:Transcript_8238/g.11989  ORF Transcript_8238/g.11989 Transcript_8238/m.11989 type:complete len:220 (+) Transcript_8238:78-737(+)
MSKPVAVAIECKKPNKLRNSFKSFGSLNLEKLSIGEDNERKSTRGGLKRWNSLKKMKNLGSSDPIDSSYGSKSVPGSVPPSPITHIKNDSKPSPEQFQENEVEAQGVQVTSSRPFFKKQNSLRSMNYSCNKENPPLTRRRHSFTCLRNTVVESSVTDSEHETIFKAASLLQNNEKKKTSKINFLKKRLQHRDSFELLHGKSGVESAYRPRSEHPLLKIG